MIYLYLIGSVIFAVMWVFLQKLALKNMSAQMFAIVSPLVAAAVGMYLLTFTGDYTLTRKSLLIAMLSGVALGLFYMCYALLFKYSEISWSYPVYAVSTLIVLAIIGALLLKESVTLYKIVGIALGATAICFLAKGG